MKCPNCETENRDGAKFCDECGFPLSGAIARAAIGIAPQEDVVDPTEKQPPIVVAEDTVSAAPVEDPVEETQVPADFEEPMTEDTADASEGDGKASEEVEVENESESPDESSAVETADDEFEGESTEAPDSDPDITTKVDLAGIDNHVDEFGERLVSPDYQAPQPNFRDGGTMQMPRVGGEEAPKSKDYLASSTKKRKRGGKLAVVAVVAVVIIAALAAFGTYQMQLWGGKVIPDVTGMTEADARSVLTDQGFEVRAEQVKSDDIEGLVLIMDPAAGSRTEKGSEVTIHIATTRTIPDIVGKKKEEAEGMLAEAGYENVKYEEKASDKAKGTVLSVEPKAGERAKSTAEITVTTAKPYTVPELAGKSIDEAIDMIKKAGLGYEAVDYETSDYPEGTVVETDPVAGTEVKKGDYVVIYVAQARGAKLEGLVEEQLGPGATVESNGKTYIVESLDSVAFLGNNTVSYTATGREYMSVFGTTVTNPQVEAISGTVVFSDDDEIIAIS